MEWHPAVTDKIVSLEDHRAKAKAARDPHLSGMARCLACKHKWAAVAPPGTADLQCPACGLLRGAWQFGVSPPVGSNKYVCLSCGCDVFRLSTLELLCIACGQSMVGWYVGQDPADRGPRGAA